uniref:Serine-threonine kinase receptor-associated protein n=1 Tax=Anopheles coluzzii TaxID=1518534 RepID=A0A8W7PXI9_ANOCL
MKPLMLQGHQRAITQIKYNREGDLIFSSAKDSKPSVWYSLNGERLGTFNGHIGAVWCVDVDWTTTRLITGAGDMNTFLWDVETGTALGKIPCNSSVRTCNFSFSGNQASYSTDRAMNHPCELFVIDVRNIDASISSADPVLKLTMNEQQSKITSMLWGALDETVITGHENGSLRIWDLRAVKELNSVNDHTASITDMQMSSDGTMFVSSSKDCSAKLFDSDSLIC